MIGAGMMTMALGLLWRSRLAWLMSVLLAATAVVNTVFTGHADVKMLLAYFAFVLVLRCCLPGEVLIDRALLRVLCSR